jgi:Secretion system C-terminal sorting domain
MGVSSPTIQNIGSLRKTGGGHLIFNSDGSQFAQCSWLGMLELYNFDRCSGTITATIPIETEPAVAPYPHWYSSCAFSPDDSKLYIADYSQTISPSYLWQYDLLSTNITASKTLIDSFVDPDMGIAQLRLAPDNKIYLSASDEGFPWPYPDTITAYTTINNNLSVINYPDSLGAACDFQPFSFNLGTGRTYYGLPNNPDYELGAWVGSPCDTLSVGISPNPKPEASWMQAWYNHEWDMIHVNASKLQGKKGVLRLFDMQGRMVFEKQAEVISGGYFTTEINMSGLASGVYLVSVVTEKEKISGKVGKY